MKHCATTFMVEWSVMLAIRNINWAEHHKLTATLTKSPVLNHIKVIFFILATSSAVEFDYKMK